MTLNELAGRLDLRLPSALTLAQKAGLMNELLRRERALLWQSAPLEVEVSAGVGEYSLGGAAFSDILSAVFLPEGGQAVFLSLWDGKGPIEGACLKDGGDSRIVIYPIPDRAGTLRLTVRWVPVLDASKPGEELLLSETAGQAAVFYAASQAAAMGYSPDTQLSEHFASLCERAVSAAAADRAREDARSPARPRENRWWRHGRG